MSGVPGDQPFVAGGGPRRHPVRGDPLVRRDRLDQPLPARRGPGRGRRGPGGGGRPPERRAGPAGAALGGAPGAQPARLGPAAPGRRRSIELHLCTAVVALAAARPAPEAAGVEPVAQVAQRPRGGRRASSPASWPRPPWPSQPRPGRGRRASGSTWAGRRPPATVGEPRRCRRELEAAGHVAVARDRAPRRAPGRCSGSCSRTSSRASSTSPRPRAGSRQGAEYRRRCATLGRRVRVELDGEVVTGDAADITAEGHLIVDVGACLRTVAAGDVVHLRADG